MAFQENENNTQELLNIFQAESEEILEKIFADLLSFESNPTDKELCATLYRELHSIKGAIRMVGFNNIQNIVHKIEDIFDKVKTQNVILAPDNIRIIFKALELVSFYLKESVENQREIINSDYKSMISAIEYLCDVELEASTLPEDNLTTNLASIIHEEQGSVENTEMKNYQEEINYTFNKCFEIIDGIVPEKETPHSNEIEGKNQVFENSNCF